MPSCLGNGQQILKFVQETGRHAWETCLYKACSLEKQGAQSKHSENLPAALMTSFSTSESTKIFSVKRELKSASKMWSSHTENSKIPFSKFSGCLRLYKPKPPFHSYSFKQQLTSSRSLIAHREPCPLDTMGRAESLEFNFWHRQWQHTVSGNHLLASPSHHLPFWTREPKISESGAG